MSRRLEGKSVLITGGAGFIGSHLADRIALENPKHLAVVDNLFLGREENLQDVKTALGAKFTFFHDDAGDRSRLAEIIDKCRADVVYNLAVIPLPASLERPEWCVMENTRLTAAVCELQRLELFETLVHFSSSETYGTAQYVPIDEAHPSVPSTPYAASKIAGDQIAMSYGHTFGLDVTCLRPFNNYGPRQNSAAFAGIIPLVINHVRRNEPVLIFGDGQQTRDYIHVRDTARAAVMMYENEEARGKVINVGSGAELSVESLVRAILEEMNATDHPVEYLPARPGDVRRHMAGTERARELLNFEPQINLDEGLAETVKWYLDQGEHAS